MKLFGIIGLVLVVIASGLYLLMPKPPKDEEEIEYIAELEEYFNKVVAAGRPPGLSVAVVKGDQIVYANGFGILDGVSGDPAYEDAVYHWWSMTKVPTAVAVMQLQERGDLDIDDPITDYLPFFEVAYQNELRQDITIRQILNHSAGLTDPVPALITWLHLEGDPAPNQTDLLQEKLPEFSKLIYLPGEKSRYSNLGFMALGALIEHVSGQTYENCIVENILIPMGMNNTNFVFTPSMAEKEVTGAQHLIDMFTPLLPMYKLTYIIRERIGMRYWFHRVYNDQTSPTGLIGPVTDVALFMGAYMNSVKGLLNSGSISI